MREAEIGAPRGNRAARWLTLALVGLLLFAGCASRAEVSGQVDAPAVQAPRTPKQISLGSTREPTSGFVLFQGSGLLVLEYTWIFQAGLTAFDPQGNLIPRIAQKVPTINDGDWQVNPDGSMAITWRLRPDVKWHDGAPLTADDFVFGVQAARDPALPANRLDGLNLIADATAIDPHTLVVHWSQPFFAANQADPGYVSALPRHLLGDVYAQPDKQGFINSSYWTTEYVGLGPYKLGTWVPGSYTDALAFDDYFLGRPKIDRIVLRYYTAATVLVTGLLSGDVDVVAPGSLKGGDLVELRNFWDARNGGTVLEMPNRVAWAQFQYRDPGLPWATDVRVRQALLHLLDRQSLADTFSPGAAPADAYVAPDDAALHLARTQGISTYPYDVTRATQLLGEAGWRRGSDGTFQNAAGQRFGIEARVPGISPQNINLGVVVADQWKQGGLDTSTYTVPNNATNLSEQRAANKGIYVVPAAIQPDVLAGLITPQIQTAQNNWTGANLGGASFPDFDRLYAQYNSELDIARRQAAYASVLKYAADNVLYLPLYYDATSTTTAFRQGITGPTVVPPIQQMTTWNIHEWDVNG